MNAGDYCTVIEYSGRQFAGVISRVLPDRVIASVANGNSDWHTVYIPLGDRPEHQLPQIQTLEQE